MVTGASVAQEYVAPADVLIVTALRMERDAVRAVTIGALGMWFDVPLPGTSLRLERRSFRAADGGELHVALVCTEEMGGEMTSGVAGAAALALRPQCVAMCGVAAGHPTDTEFGDVVIADRLLLHDSGKRKEGRFEHEPRAKELPLLWRTRARDFSEAPGDALAWLERPAWTPEQQRAWLLDQLARGLNPPARRAYVEECCPSYAHQLKALWDEGLVARGTFALTDAGRAHLLELQALDLGWPSLDLPRRSVGVHVGPMAAGNAVQATSALWEELALIERKTLAVEMESHGIGVVRELFEVPLALVMKGVMDHADKHKDDRFKNFAARAAAECLIAFLRRHHEPTERPGWDDILEPGTIPPPGKPPPSALLDARHEVVPFYEKGRRNTLAELDQWCESRPNAAVRLIHAEGGVGKTRLAIEWVRRRRFAGWQAGFLPRDVPSEWLERLVSRDEAVAVVIDYAETRDDLHLILARVLRYRQKPEGARRRVRVLLLARSDGDWWTMLQQSDTVLGTWLAETPTLELPPVAMKGEARTEVFVEAVAAFAALLGKTLLLHPQLALTSACYDRALYLHMAALATIEELPFEAGTLLDRILDHEERFWDERGRQLHMLAVTRHKTLARQVVTAATLRGGLATFKEAAVLTERMMQRVPGSEQDELLTLLHRVYERPQNKRLTESFLPGLAPDLLAEGMVLRLAAIPSSSPHHVPDDWIERVFVENDTNDTVRTAFEVLARASATQNDEATQSAALLRPWLVRMLPGPPLLHAVLALEATKRVGKHTALAVLGDVLAERLEAHGDITIAQALETAGIPHQSVMLQRVAEWRSRVLLGTLSNAEDEAVLLERERRLSIRAVELSGLGRREEALEVTHEAVQIGRTLAEKRLDDIPPSLVGNLNNLGVMLSALGRQEEALEVAREAVQIGRLLVRNRSNAASLLGLGTGLNNMGVLLHDLGRREEALGASHEAFALFRRLVEARPDDFLPDLAGSLTTLSATLSSLGRREEALEASHKAVQIRRTLAERHPDAFLPFLIGALITLSSMLNKLGSLEEALEVARESVQIGRALARTRPDAFLPDLAKGLVNLGVMLSNLKRWEEALMVTREATDLHRSFAQTHPDAFLPDFAKTLTNLSAGLSMLGRHEEALEVARESVQIRRMLVERRPDAFLPDLAMSLITMGAVFGNVRHGDEALNATYEAVQIYRALARTRPDVFLPDLAIGLSNLGGDLGNLGRREEALEATREAVQIRRTLAEKRSDTFLPDLAHSLNNLYRDLRALDRWEEALEATREAVWIRRALVEKRPDAFLPDLAISLDNLGIVLRKLDQPEEALWVTQKAVECYDALARAHPDDFLPNLAERFADLGGTLRDLGRWEEALEAIHATAKHFRMLAQKLPDKFLPDLAESLTSLSNMLRDVGLQEEALKVAQDASECCRALAQTRPDEFLPDFAMNLNNVGILLRDRDRREEGLSAIQKAVELFRGLAQKKPEAFLSSLAMSLHNLGTVLRDLGRREEGLDATREAVQIRRTLVDKRPDEFLSDLAISLNNQGAMLSELGHREEALRVTHEAVGIYRTLAHTRPDTFLPSVAISLNTLGATLRGLERYEEALASVLEAVDLVWPLFLRLPTAFVQETHKFLAHALILHEQLGRTPSDALVERQKSFQSMIREQAAPSTHEDRHGRAPADRYNVGRGEIEVRGLEWTCSGNRTDKNLVSPAIENFRNEVRRLMSCESAESPAQQVERWLRVSDETTACACLNTGSERQEAGDLAIQCADQAILIARQHGLKKAEADALVTRSRVIGLAEDPDLERANLDRVRSLYLALNLPLDAALSRGITAGHLAGRGKVEAAIQVFRDEVIPVFKQYEGADKLFDLVGGIVLGLVASARMRDGIRILREVGCPALIDLGRPDLALQFASSVAQILTADGRHTEALALLVDEVIPAARTFGGVQSLVQTEQMIASAYVARGNARDLDLALFHAKAAEKIAHREGPVGLATEAKRFSNDIARQRSVRDPTTPNRAERRAARRRSRHG